MTAKINNPAPKNIKKPEPPPPPTKKKTADLSNMTKQLLSEAYDHLDGMRAGCECEDIGGRCIDCLCNAIENFIESNKQC